MCFHVFFLLQFLILFFMFLLFFILFFMFFVFHWFSSFSEQLHYTKLEGQRMTKNTRAPANKRKKQKKKGKKEKRFNQQMTFRITQEPKKKTLPPFSCTWCTEGGRDGLTKYVAERIGTSLRLLARPTGVLNGEIRAELHLVKNESLDGQLIAWFHVGSEPAEGFSSPACAETSLLLAWRPSSQTPLGVIPVASGTVPSLRDRAARVTSLYLRGRRCTAAPNGREPPTTHVPQPLLHLARRLRASLALYGLWCGVAIGGVRQVWPLPPRGPGTGGLRRDRLHQSSEIPQWQATTLNPGNLRRHSRWPHEDPLTASSERPSERGWRDEVPGSDQPKSSHVLCGTSGGLVLWCLRVPLKSTSAHQCPRLCLRAKDHLTTPDGVLPEVLRPKRRPVRPRTVLAATEEWRPGRRLAVTQRQREPTQWQSWMDNRVALQPPPVCSRGGRWFTHGVGTANTPCSPVALHALRRLHSVQPCTWAPPRWLPASPTTRNRVCVATEHRWLRSLMKVQNFARDGERSRRVKEARKQVSSRDVQKFVRGRGLIRSLAVRILRSCADHGHLPAFGLYMSLRHPVPAGASSRAHESDRAPEVARMHIFLLTGFDGYFLVSRSWRPPKSGSRVILCETQANGVALWASLRRSVWISASARLQSTQRNRRMVVLVWYSGKPERRLYRKPTRRVFTVVVTRPTRRVQIKSEVWVQRATGWVIRSSRSFEYKERQDAWSDPCVALEDYESDYSPLRAVGVDAPPRLPCHKSALSKQQWLHGDCPISQVFLVFPRHTANANLGARVDEVGFTIVQKSASVLTVFQTRGFRATVLYGDCPTLYGERMDE